VAIRRDPLTPEARSETMRRVRSRDTKPELMLRRELYRRGFRYRVDYPRAPGRPDIAMVGRNVAVFVEGAFWHGKRLSPERLAEMSDYWRGKIARNVARDVRVNAELTAMGWTVMRITDRAIERNLDAVSDCVEQVATDRFCECVPAGIEVWQP